MKWGPGSAKGEQTVVEFRASLSLLKLSPLLHCKQQTLERTAILRKGRRRAEWGLLRVPI